MASGSRGSKREPPERVANVSWTKGQGQIAAPKMLLTTWSGGNYTADARRTLCVQGQAEGQPKNQNAGENEQRAGAFLAHRH